MPGFTMLGDNSRTTFLALEPEKISVEFEAAAAVKRGQPVKLDTTGKVTPWAKADTEAQLLGIAYTDASTGQLVTVWTRGYVLMYGISNATQNAGLCTFESYDSATDVNGTKGYSKFSVSPTAGQEMGWALDAATAANQLIRVLVKN